MAKIIAIHGGGDWSDASASYIVPPDWMNITDEKRAWGEWYKREYLPSLRSGEKPRFTTLQEWCISRGAREPNPDELEVLDDE